MRARALALTLSLAAGCAAGDTGPLVPTPSGTASPSPARYETLEEIAAAFGCEKLQDVGTGENAGLTAFGICYVGRHNVDIYMTSNRGAWEHLADEFPSVLGPNWIVVCPTGAKAARIVQRRLDGELRVPRKRG